MIKQILNDRYIKIIILVFFIAFVSFNNYSYIHAQILDENGDFIEEADFGGEIPEPAGSGVPESKPKVGLENPLKVKNITELIKFSVQLMIYIGTILSILLLIWVGFLFVASRGNPEKISQAKTWLFYIVIGTAILFASRLIVEIIFETVKSTGLVDERLFR